MKILQVTSRFYPAIGGVESHVYDLSTKLVLLGHNVEVLTSNLFTVWPPTKLPHTFKSDQLFQGFRIKRFNASLVLRIGEGHFPIYSNLLTNTLRTESDIIHVHGLHDFTIFSTFPSIISRKKIILTGHLNPFGRMFNLKNYSDRTFGKFILKHISAIISFSPSEMMYLKNTFGKIGIDKIFLVPPAIDVNKFKTTDENVIHYKDRHCMNTTKNILYVGRLSKEKGIFELLTAYSLINQRHPNEYKLILVGEATDIHYRIIQFAKEKGILKNIIFTGVIRNNKLAEVYNSADLFVLPSFFESYGRVLLEAMSTGLPIVSTNVGSIPDLIVSGENGLLVPPNDAMSLMKAILMIFEDNDLRKRMCNNNILKIRNHHDLDNRINKIEYIYKKVMSNI